MIQATGPLTQGKQAKDKPKPGSKNVEEVSTSPQDPDERLFFDAYTNAVQQADKIVS